MERTIRVTSAYLGFPVKAEQKKELIEIFEENEKQYELQIPVGEADDDGTCDYYAYLKVSDFTGKTLTLKGKLGNRFFENIVQTDQPEWPPIAKPLIHFAADRGWLNDPNGLVYHDGVYHLYFQYNQFDTQWDNMSWGHAVSTDLLNFRQMDTVLYPDEHGSMYSGCGLVNERGLLGLPEDALVFFYTAAGGINPWSKGKMFTQRIAVSTDGGRTLKKLPQEAVGVIEEDSRDPQVFWHEQSKSYIMMLWLKDGEIGILRSSDLQNWELASRVILPGAFECPNLFCLQNDGQEQWVLLIANGSYYLGQFDGYSFETDGVKNMAYLSSIPYAAQVYNGVKDRVVLVPWLHMKNEGKLYTGMMGLPRELALTGQGSEARLQMLPVREYEISKRELNSFETHGEEISFEIREEAVTELCLQMQDISETMVEFFGEKLVIRKDEVIFREEKTALPESLTEVRILIDRQIVEIIGNQGTLNMYYETGSDELTGTITVKGCHGKGTCWLKGGIGYVDYH